MGGGGNDDVGLRKNDVGANHLERFNWNWMEVVID